MNNKLNPYNTINKTERINQFSEHGIYVREDDQDWGSSGMDNIEKEVLQKQRFNSK